MSRVPGVSVAAVARGRSWQGRVWLLAGALLLLRAALVPLVPTPWIWADEGVYADTAYRIGHEFRFYPRLRAVQPYPPGYPLALVPATFLGGARANYRGMLLTNCLLASLVGVLVFYLARRYVPGRDAFWASALAAVLPSVSAYPYVLMSENLFIPLLVGSCLLAVRASESRTPLAWLWVGLGVGALMLTRSVGVMAVPAAAAVVLLEWVRRRRWLYGTAALGALVAGFALLAGPWVLVKSLHEAAPPSLTGYREDAYLANLFQFLSDWLVFRTVLRLTLHQWLGVGLASAGVFLLFAVDLIFPGERRLSPSFRTLVLYFAVLAAGLTVASTMHMWRGYLWGGDSRFALIMRYMDPLVPVVVLLGVVGLVRFREGLAGRGARWRLGLVAALGLFLFVNPGRLLPVGYPMEGYKFPNVLSVWYVEPMREFLDPGTGRASGEEAPRQGDAGGGKGGRSLGDLVGLPPSVDLRRIVITAAALAFIAPFLLSGKFLRRHYGRAALAFFLLVNVPTLFQEVRVSRAADPMNAIPKWLCDNARPGERVYFDEGDYYRGKGMFLFYATCFWNPDLAISRYRREVARLEPDYVISWDRLPLQAVLEGGPPGARRRLYRTGGAEGVRAILDDPRYFDVARMPPGSIENAWEVEQGGWVWTKHETRFRFRYRLPEGPWVLALSGGGPRPRNNAARLKVLLDGHLLRRPGPVRRPLDDPRRVPPAPRGGPYSHVKGPGNAVWRFPVPAGAARRGEEHVLTIRTNTFVPARDLTDNDDPRELGIQVFWFKIEETEEPGPAAGRQ